MKPVKLHLSADTLEIVRNLAKQRGTTVSEMVRRRLKLFLTGDHTKLASTKTVETSIQLEEKMRADLTAEAERRGIGFRTLIKELVDHAWSKR